jgi:cysteine desulfurase
LINANPRDIFFTSGGTEADNQAILSYMLSNSNRGRHLITSAIEHHAVLDTCEYLSKNGFDLTVLPVNKDGLVDPDDLKKALKPETTLVTIMHANNEVGTIQPIKELAAIAHEVGAAFHTDAVQTVGKIIVDVNVLGVDLLSASSHKLYGPKGVGCLFIKKGTKIEKFLHGGPQEAKMRAGTENVPGIVGFGKAAEIAQNQMSEYIIYLTRLGKKLQDGIRERIPNTIFTGHPQKRIPGHISVCFEFIEGESILLMLDSYGIMASSGSACTSGALEPSHVLTAMGIAHEIVHGSLRLTLGKDNTEEDIDYVLEVLPGVVERLRTMSPLNN